MSESHVPVVRQAELPEPPKPRTLVCANCGADLQGIYCAACGQRHEPHVHGISHFAAEALESISHADSRLWRTLIYLLARPGYLTRQFFDGKRVAYLPPFRLYLVISVLFFLVANLPDEFGGGKKAKSNIDAEPAAESVQGLDGAPKVQAQQQPVPESDATASKKQGLQDENFMTDFCKNFQKPDPKAGENYEKLRSTCAKLDEDHGASLVKEIVHNLPRAMFVFLPLLALGMKLLYWRPKRYYVEHLLLLIHNHAFVFLVLAILGVLKRIPFVGEHLGLLEAGVWVYIIYYLFRAMRAYYQQSRALTFWKYLAIGYGYLLAGFTVLIGTAIFTAITL